MAVRPRCPIPRNTLLPLIRALWQTASLVLLTKEIPELANWLALTILGDQMVLLPLLEELGKGIKTAEQGDGRVFHEGDFPLCGD